MLSQHNSSSSPLLITIPWPTPLAEAFYPIKVQASYLKTREKIPLYKLLQYPEHPHCNALNSYECEFHSMGLQLKIREPEVQASWFLDPGGWSKTATVSLYFIFPGICTLSL
ncbi:hypothetical protein STEG23_033449, partial [Scotinomys teguina]